MYKIKNPQKVLLFIADVLRRTASPGNRRFTLFRNKKVEWVPLKVSYFFIEDEDDESFRFVPKVYDEDEWSANPTQKTSPFKSRNNNLTFHN